MTGARFPTKIGMYIKLVVRKTKTMVPTTDDPWNDHDHAHAPPHQKFKNARFSTKIGTYTIFGEANPKMIVPTASDATKDGAGS